MTRDEFFNIVEKENLIDRMDYDVSLSQNLPLGCFTYGCVYDNGKWRVCLTNERRTPSFIKDFNNESDALEFFLEELREEAALIDAKRSIIEEI